jgi:hypothetical protein
MDDAFPITPQKVLEAFGKTVILNSGVKTMERSIPIYDFFAVKLQKRPRSSILTKW